MIRGMQDTEMGVGDLMATFQGTYVRLVDEDGESEVVRVQGEEDGEVLFRTLHGDDIYIDIYNTDTEVDTSWPALGYINYLEWAVYVKRRAQRQWKRGLRESATTWTVEGLYMSQLLTGEEMHLRFNDPIFLESLFCPHYSSFQEAYEAVLQQDVYAQAFSPNYAVTALPRLSVPALMWRSQMVGVCLPEGALLHSEMKHLLPSLKRDAPSIKIMEASC